MTDPLFWLVLSLLFVTISLTIVLVIAIPTLRELSRAARSAEKLFDTLRREFPPTLQAIRLTGLEISDLTEDVSEGVQSAGQVVKQVDQSLTGVRQQAQRVQYSTRSVVVGLKAAWRTFTQSPKSTTQRRGVDRPPTPRPEAEFNSASYDSDSYNSERTSNSERPSDALLETTRMNARRVMPQEETLSQPMPSRNDDLASRDPSDPRNDEKGLSTTTPRKVERLRSSRSNQPNSNAAIPDPSNYQHGTETIDYQD